MQKRRVGLFLGLSIVALVGGIIGYNIGNLAPDTVTNTVKVSHDAAPITGAVLMALLAAGSWAAFELLTTVARSVAKDATTVRLAISLIGSLFSLITAELKVLGISLFNANGHTIFSYFPLATGLGAIAIGTRALVRQINLNRQDERRGRHHTRDNEEETARQLARQQDWNPFNG